MMNKMKKNRFLGIVSIALLFGACNIPTLVQKPIEQTLPEHYASEGKDSTNTAKVNWRTLFKDEHLTGLIDSALKHNQELNITVQEINRRRYEIGAKKGEYLPFVGIGASAGAEKVGRYTSKGANDATTDIRPGEEMPEPLPDFMVGAYAKWELDIWNKLHNAKKAAVMNYLSSIEGKNFMVTNLVSEIANSYYELMALDNQLEILQQNIAIQQNALKIVKLQKQSAKVTELAVKRFEAEVLKNQSRQYTIIQQITETENRINFLVGRFPQKVERSSSLFNEQVPDTVYAGLPAQLLSNRPDIKAAEYKLVSSRINVRVAKANFYPSLSLRAGVGYQAFNPKFLIQTPQSMLYALAGELSAPLINRKAIKATYLKANATQISAVYSYEQTLLNAYTEVANQLSMIGNLKKSYELKEQQVAALTESISIAYKLFASARADYMEVLLTQRDALEARFDLVETKRLQMNAMVKVYQALGGGWTP